MERRGQLKKEFKVRVYKYIINLLKLLEKIPDKSVVREIKSQLTRSGTSVGANYFEAEAASSKKDFQKFFYYALKSANESKFWLATLRDAELVSQENTKELESLLLETKELANILASSILTMKRKK